jgi:hypothetical protein
MKRHIPAIAAFAVMMAPATAQASTYLHVGEAKLQTKRLGLKLKKTLKAEVGDIERCQRVDSHRVRCTLAFHGMPSDVPQVCRFTTYVNKDVNGIRAVAKDEVCVEDPTAEAGI